jgi:Na+-driven multidrug efflux pump
MTALNLLNQLLNFMAPAVFVTLVVVLLVRVFPGIFRSKRPMALSLWGQIAIIFIASLLVLAVGLVIFGRDGKMATYAALAVGAATCQWVLLRGWKA